MNQFDQHSAILALEKALVPTADLVDSRTETDHLRLLVDFASLFNFYDRTNSINGNWSPFLLKDPVFLVASIAKTSFQKAYSLFINTCFQLQKALNQTALPDFISNAFNQLFDKLCVIFQIIERWTYYMQQSSMEYNLKTYVINNVKDTYGLILWSLLELRKQLYNYAKKPNTKVKIPGILNVNSYAFQNFNPKIWSVNKGTLPYWEVLGLPTTPCLDEANQQCFDIYNVTQQDLYNSLFTTGKKVFAFYSKCISYAATELETIQKVPGHFPDTILLRTFTSLLKIYKKQFNGLSEKHLHFYYHDILKQSPNSVTPDTVFASFDLSKKANTFKLLKGTIFNAGLDSNKEAILFKTTKNVSLNSAKIVNAYTLSQKNTHPFHNALFLKTLPPVNVVSKDKSGTIQSWKTFGSQLNAEGIQQKMAFSISSPMLYLTEASSRIITFNFTFSNANFTKILQEDTTFYLSTAKTWFSIPKEQIVLDFTTPDYKLPMTIDRLLKITITLKATDPIIAAFTKNPDGYACDWPLFKMEFSEYENLADPPQIKKLSIDVVVDGLQNFELYNDFGQLNAKKPFQLFGPAPKMNQHFRVGSAEIFSKPVNSISFQINWNPFASNFDFSTYYQEYNNYLNNLYSGSPEDIEAIKEKFKQIINSQETFFTDISNTQKKLFQTIDQKDPTKAISQIQAAQSELVTTATAEVKNLQKIAGNNDSTVNAIINNENSMVTAIKNAQNELMSNIKVNQKVPIASVASTETSILNTISTTQNYVFEKLLSAENTTLTTTLHEKKSLFKRITSSIGNIFHKHEKVSVTHKATSMFSNTAFKVNFQWLKNGVWNTFTTNVNDHNVSSEALKNLYFPFETTTDYIPPVRTFSFTGLTTDSAVIDPSLQLSPLKFSEQSTKGFLQMTLSDPTYGFGVDLYPKVVAAIALFNAEIIAEKIKDTSDTQTLISPANIPFVPMVKLFSGTYTASVTYDFSNNNEAYPLQCFYNTPFKNYKVYDNTSVETPIITENTTLGNSPDRTSLGTIIPLKALPLVPKFSSKGQLFLELQDLIIPASVSFYIELTRTYTENVLSSKEISYSYLSNTGWKTLPSIADDTNKFTCSGIITIDIPEDIATQHDTIAGNNYWIAIGTTHNLDSFPETSFLKSNGCTLQRIVASNDFSTEVPQIKANTITGPKTAIPEIASVEQPFPSFGGKAAETKIQTNSRVSNRLKTKDRLVAKQDYFNTIRIEFPQVYYSKTSYDNLTNQTQIFVAKRVSDVNDTNAFIPLLSECNELEIQNYIAQRTSAFSKIVVENFKLNYVKITADILLNSYEDVTSVSQEINNGINLFLAPWITSAQTQITIDNGLDTAELAAFINEYDSVLEITTLSFQIGTKDFTTGQINYQDHIQEIAPTNGVLLVPSLNNLTENSLIKYHL